MRRRGNIGSRLWIPVGLLIVGVVITAAAAAIRDRALSFAGITVLAAVVLVFVLFGINLLRALAQRRAVHRRTPGAMSFHAAMISPHRTSWSGMGWMGIAVVSDTGLDVMRGTPLTLDWGARWSDIASIRAAQESWGQQLVPVLIVSLAAGGGRTLRLLGDLGIEPTFGYAERLAAELEAQRAKWSTRSRSVPGSPMLPGTTT